MKKRGGKDFKRLIFLIWKKEKGEHCTPNKIK